MSLHLSPRRLTAAAALGVAAVLACAAPASAAPADAATWLSGPALTGGNHIEIGGYSYDGTSADAVYALAAAGGHLDTVAAIDAYLKTDVTNYADPAGSNTDYPGPYSGSLAKLALVAEITGQDPHAYGGVDLLGVLAAKTCTAAIPVDPTSMSTPCNAAGEFYQAGSPVSQALGVIALQRSSHAADHLTSSSAPVTRLLALRCTDGLYSGDLLAEGDTCATGDADISAYVAQALAAVSGADDASVTSVLTALAAAQDPQTGGFDGASGINTNTAGVALSAFSLQPTAFATQITRATAFVEGLQRSDGAYPVSATDASDDGAKGATPQALLGVLGRNLADPTLVVALPVATTPPTTTAPTSGAAASTTASQPELAATGVSHGHLTTELLLAAVAIGGGVLVLRVGARRLPVARHRG